ncbi:CHAT domain-containing protein [Lapillicoccus sp.]|uniref:CHAT domain-containing protein n=1 Tax=Lapillicoccus sp. TaxID=1909287 RepID=UPI0032661E45
MNTDPRGAPPDTDDAPDLVEVLLPLALSQPARALTTARSLLAGRSGRVVSVRDRSVAHQTIAIVERDRGRLTEARREIVVGLRLARQVGPERTADVLATYAVTLVYAGRTAASLRRLDEALPLTPHTDRPRLLLRRAHVLHVVGRYTEALEVIGQAIRGSRAAGDLMWEARGLNNRAVIHLALGSTDEAAQDAHRAATIFRGLGRDLELTHAVHNQAEAAYERGHLPEALELYALVADRYSALDVVEPDLTIDQATALLSAGLVDEARGVLDAALASADLTVVKRAELLLLLARTAVPGNDLATTRARADEAARLFAAQGRRTFVHRATLLSLQARERDPLLDRRGRRALARTCDRLLVDLEQEDSRDLPEALLLRARLARQLGRGEVAEASLAAVSERRLAGPPLTRAVGWLATALLADQRSDRRALRHACARGLDSVDEYRSLLGDIELRALASRHGLELADLAVADAVQSGDTRGLLGWSERWRATALVGAAATRPDDPELDRNIAALRDVTRRLSAFGEEQPVLARERTRLESAVRTRYRQVAAHHGVLQAGSPRRGVRALLEAVEAQPHGTALVSGVNVRGVLYAVVVAGGRVARHEIGPLASAVREAEFARFTLRRSAFGRPVDLQTTGLRLQRALLGDHVERWRAPRVVVVPPAELLTAPFGLMPAFGDTVVTAAPSASLWLRTLERSRQSWSSRQSDQMTGSADVALVCGPGLRAGEDEVRALEAVHPGARCLVGDEATVDAALALMDGARLAHVVAHGSFRVDAPLFSSLLLCDGPLTVHDFDRLERAPESVVLSACDLGSSGAVGAYEALGLVSSLLAVGSRSVMASVVPVNDYATVPVVSVAHTVVAQGGSLAEGLLAARQAATEPVVAATAASFTVWGV